MVTNKFIVGKANAINALVVEGLEKVKAETASNIEAIPGLSFDDGMSIVSTIISRVGAVYKCAIVDGIGFPDFLTGFNAEGGLNEVTVTIKSKLKAERKFKEQATVKVDENFIESLGELFTNTLFARFYTEAASENVEALNVTLASILDEEGINKKVEFAITDTEGRVAYIDNDKIVIKADVAEALDISRLGIMTDTSDEEDGYNKIIYNEARKEFVDIMRTVQITPEIIKKQISFVESLGNLHTKKHSNKIIREAFHKKASNLTGKKADEIGYFSEKVTVDGKEVNVFALLTKDGNKYTVVLNPYDALTNTAVDFDVIGALA